MCGRENEKQTTSFNCHGNKRKDCRIEQLVPRQVIRFKLFVIIRSGVAG